MEDKNTTDRNEITSLMYTIANVGHAEYHMLELIMANKGIFDNTATNEILINEMKVATGNLRKMRSALMARLGELRPAVRGLHCVMKHLILSEYHLFELYEKDPDDRYIKIAQKIHLIMDTLLGLDGLKDLKSCPRCDDDKNVGRVSKSG